MSCFTIDKPEYIKFAAALISLQKHHNIDLHIGHDFTEDDIVREVDALFVANQKGYGERYNEEIGTLEHVTVKDLDKPGVLHYFNLYTNTRFLSSLILFCDCIRYQIEIKFDETFLNKAQRAFTNWLMEVINATTPEDPTIPNGWGTLAALR